MVAAAVLVVALGALATLVIVLTRSSDESDRPLRASASASARAGKVPGTSTRLPRPHLTTDEERFAALLEQVHGRGQESTELRSLISEEAALFASVSQRECDPSSVVCKEYSRIREFVLGSGNASRIAGRGPSSAIDSSWMAGLESPGIPIENDPRVQHWFDYYVKGRQGRELLQLMLRRCGAYQDLIETALIRNDLPVDLLAVVFAESGCDPRTRDSPAGAAGLWQFMPAAARAYHLRVKEGVLDERRSPPKATRVAARYLRDLRRKFSNYDDRRAWDLVLGSYNMGSFGMAARLERAGDGVGFWDLVDAQMVPKETAEYVPRIQAIALILKNQERLDFAAGQLLAPQLTADLEAPPGTRLSLIARAASTSVEQLRRLNLDIVGDATPDVSKFAVQVPDQVVFRARARLKELLATRDEWDQCVPATFDWGRDLFDERRCQHKAEASPKP